jgi:hypothetical protein
MKINKKALELIEKGLSSTTVSKLDESQISILHKRLFLGEQVEEMPAKKSYKVGQDGGNLPASPKGYNVKKTATGDVVATPNESELEEDVEVTTDPNKETETQDPQQVGPSSDDGFGDENDGMGMFESEADLKPGQPNPWAICHAQVGPKRTRKFERCVQSVKKQLEEGKNPVSLFIENQIMKIVEKNLPPRITKGDLIRHLSEGENFATKHLQSFGKSSGTETAPAKPKTSPTTKPGAPDKKPRPAHPGKNPNPGEKEAPKAKKEVEEQNPAVAPTKPKTSPTTKPGTKPQRPAHPGKNPNPGEKESPKAKNPSPEETKDKVIDVILNLLQK